jgi:hypothetical protein
MTTYLLTWNPSKFDWSNRSLGKLVRSSASGNCPEFHWSCGTSLKPKKGDRVFLTKLGTSGRGLFASGHLTRDAYFRDEDFEFGNAVDVAWDVLLDPREEENLLNPKELRDPELAGQMWAPQMSGIVIRPRAAARLETLWREHCGPRGATNHLAEPAESHTHRFRLRADLELSFDLPTNLTRREAERIAGFIQALVIEERIGENEVIAKASRTGLGASTDQPTGATTTLPSGVKVRDQFRGGASKGVRVGSGHGYVDVGLRLQGTGESRSIEFPAGQTMISSNPSVQHGILVQPVTIEVAAQKVRDWVLSMYCANKTRQPANEDTEYTLGPVVRDPALDELFGLLNGKHISADHTELVQNAVWEITDGEGLTRELRRALSSIA